MVDKGRPSLQSWAKIKAGKRGRKEGRGEEVLCLTIISFLIVGYV